VFLGYRPSSSIADAEASVFVVFGLACIVKPKFGNLSRAMGVFFVGAGVICVAASFGWWREFVISLAIVIAPSLIWGAVECFRLQKARALSRFVGATLSALAVGSEYFSWLIWSHIPTR
jgi:hypothetical protein